MDEESGGGVLAPCPHSQLHFLSISLFPGEGKPAQAWTSRLRRKSVVQGTAIRPGWTPGFVCDKGSRCGSTRVLSTCQLPFCSVIFTKPQNLHTRQMSLLSPFINEDTEAQRDFVR